MSDPARPASPDLYNNFLDRQSWPEPWDPSEFSPDQRRMKIYNRIQTKTRKSFTEDFLEYFIDDPECWPWGYFIYRTAYGSDEDWNQALAKLHRHMHHTLLYDSLRLKKENDPEQVKEMSEVAETVFEGYRNVILEDRELLDGASPAQVRQLFKEWIKRNPKYLWGGPRSSFCLMIDDHAIHSILGSSEPPLDPRDHAPKQPGYVILIDRHFPDKGGLRHEPYNVGWVRLTMGGGWKIWRDAASGDDLMLEEVYPPIRRAGLIPYYNGRWPWVEDVNGQEVKKTNGSGNTEEKDEEDPDKEEDGYTEEGGYPFYEIYEYLREGGHI